MLRRQYLTEELLTCGFRIPLGELLGCQRVNNALANRRPIVGDLFGQVFSRGVRILLLVILYFFVCF